MKTLATGELRPVRATARRASCRSARRLVVEVLENRWVAASDAFVPLAGDWDGDGDDSLGLYDTAGGQFFLRDINAPGFPNQVISAPGATSNSLPLAGDWDGDGRDTPGFFDRTAGAFKLLNSAGQIVEQRLPPVSLPANAQVVAGNFAGDDRDELAIYLPDTKQIWQQGDSGWEAVTIDLPDNRTLRLLAGDFDRQGNEEVALFDKSQGQLYRAGRMPQVTGLFDDGSAPTFPLAGDWSGQGLSTLGWYRTDTGTFTPWLVNDVDPLATPFYVAPSRNVLGQPDQANPLTWQNSRQPLDVDGDGRVTTADAALVLSTINALGPRALPEFRHAAGNEVFFDSSGDHLLSPLDVLLVMNGLNAGLGNAEPQPPLAINGSLDADEVEQLLKRAAAASASNDAIIAIVDRSGNILGVRTESGVVTAIPDLNTLVFAIDGAVAKARTAAFFSNSAAPLTSRTVRFISQSTITQREIESNPNTGNFNSTFQGPGFVAPVGTGGHFPPQVQHTPVVDLFGIEHTNRDSLIHPGMDGIKGTADDLNLASRFNVNPAFISAGQEIFAPESYGYASGRYVNAQSRGIATLPGGVPLYEGGVLVGGIGVFFPGSSGTATYEQNFVAGVGQSEVDRTNAPRALEAEWIAFAAAGGSSGAFAFTGVNAIVGALNGIPPVPGYDLPFGRIDLAGITLEIYGPNPTAARPQSGVQTLLDVGALVGRGNPLSGVNQPVTPANDLFLSGQAVPEGWLVLPHASGGISAADVERIITQGVNEATLARAAIRLTAAGQPGARTRMVFAVSDLDGNVLGLYRMPDATVFSIDVSVAKARNVSYYDDPAALVSFDQVDDNRDGQSDLPLGTSLTARTFRFLAAPRFPSGVDGSVPGAFSSLRDPGINVANAENVGPALPASFYASNSSSTFAFDAYRVGRNFRDPSNLANQNGVVFFPGSTALYVNGQIAGGLGVSGDGVDQDDLVTYMASVGNQTPGAIRADQYFVRGTRLPFQKFPRNPHA